MSNTRGVYPEYVYFAIKLTRLYLVTKVLLLNCFWRYTYFKRHRCFSGQKQTVMVEEVISLILSLTSPVIIDLTKCHLFFIAKLTVVYGRTVHIIWVEIQLSCTSVFPAIQDTSVTFTVSPPIYHTTLVNLAQKSIGNNVLANFMGR